MSLNPGTRHRIMVAAYTAEGGSFQRGPSSEFWICILTAKQDKVVFIFNFFDQLRQFAPAK